MSYLGTDPLREIQAEIETLRSLDPSARAAAAARISAKVDAVALADVALLSGPAHNISPQRPSADRP
jgi:hypothetical protein